MLVQLVGRPSSSITGGPCRKGLVSAPSQEEGDVEGEEHDAENGEAPLSSSISTSIPASPSGCCCCCSLFLCMCPYNVPPATVRTLTIVTTNTTHPSTPSSGRNVGEGVGSLDPPSILSSCDSFHHETLHHGAVFLSPPVPFPFPVSVAVWVEQHPLRRKMTRDSGAPPLDAGVCQQGTKICRYKTPGDTHTADEPPARSGRIR